MFKTAVIIGAHREELAFGEKTAKGLPKKGIEIIRIEKGISNRPSPDHLNSERMADLQNLYYGIDKKARGRFQLVLDLHCGYGEEGWSADVFCAETAFLDAMEKALNPPSGKKSRLPPDVRLFKVMLNGDDKPLAFDERFPVCLSFVPETIINGSHYLYVGLEFYLTCKKGRWSDHRRARRLILGVQGCAGTCL
jgi:hypothetical protein